MARQHKKTASGEAARPRPARSGFEVPRRLKPPKLSMRNRYSLFVASMKVLLPAMAAALILLIIVWPQFQVEEERFRVSVSDLTPEQANNLSMLNARFDGVDEKNQPFTLTADEATQLPEKDDLIELAFPKADITLSDGTWLAMDARNGEYQRNVRLLDLEGQVTLFHDQGFELHTDSARVDLADSSAQGFDLVEGQGPFGTLRSEGFRVLERGEVIHFLGKSHMTFVPEAEGTW